MKPHYNSTVVIALQVLGSLFIFLALIIFITGSPLFGLEKFYAILICLVLSLPFFFFAGVLDSLIKHSELLQSILDKLSEKDK